MDDFERKLGGRNSINWKGIYRKTRNEINPGSPAGPATGEDSAMKKPEKLSWKKRRGGKTEERGERKAGREGCLPAGRIFRQSRNGMGRLAIHARGPWI
jgi:hypothetical protein